MKRLILTVSVILLVVLLLFSGFLLYEETVVTVRTRANLGEISAENSLTVSTPTCAQADGEQITRLQIFCLNPQGLGEPDIRTDVQPIRSVDQMEIRTIQAVTDQNGKAIYDITSLNPGIFELEVSCADTQVKADHRVCFN